MMLANPSLEKSWLPHLAELISMMKIFSKASSSLFLLRPLFSSLTAGELKEEEEEDAASWWGEVEEAAAAAAAAGGGAFR